MVNTDDVRSGVGTHPVVWSFVDPGTNRPATAETVSFYVAGLSHTAEVTIYEQNEGKISKLGTFTNLNGPNQDNNRLYTFHASNGKRIRQVSHLYDA